jgi:hypothetical protein
VKALVHTAALLGLVVVACGRVAGAPAPIEPVNVCPAHPCSAYQPYVADGSAAQCNAGFCQVAATLDYTLVVAIPETSYFAPGMTFVVPFSSLFQTPTKACPAGTCGHLPNISVVGGEYWPLPSVQAPAKANYYLGDMIVVPVQTVFRPLSSVGGGSTSEEAALLGLPLLPTLASVVPFTSIFTSGGLPGPDGDPNVAFHAELPPGKYERTIMPDPPFDAYFPPRIDTPTLTSGTLAPTLETLVSFDTMGGESPADEELTVMREDGASLEGWTAYLEDATTLRRVSAATAIANLTPTSTSPFTYDVPLPTNRDLGSGNGFENAQLMLVPPAGSVAIPTLVAPYQAGTILAPPYPTLIGPPATVSGSVTTADGGLPVPSTLLIESTKILTNDSPTTDLVYSTDVATIADGGNAASYQVALPPGNYTVTIVPSDATSAKQSLPLLVASTTMNGEVVNLTQAGKNLALAAKTLVTGVASVSDGRALAAAQVEANPAASLGPASLASPPTPVSSWPRSATTTTAADGTFVLALDPGTYDITVRPVDGTFLPWVVSPSRQVGSSPLALDPIVVPAPIVASLRLADPQDNAIVGAIVRVFAVPTGGTAYVESGRALTDENGHYDMFVAGTPH